MLVSCDDDVKKSPLNPSTPTSSTSFPSPYPIPDIWGEEVDKILKEKRLTPYARKEIVNTLCCSIKVYTNGRPTAAQCTLVARAPVDKYHFLIGCETVSFVVNCSNCIFYYRVRGLRRFLRNSEMLENIEKEHMAKQIKVLLLLYSQRRAPSEHDIKAMEQELKNERPREDILVQLMSSTFAARRSLVQSKQVVADILKTYPALRMTAIVS